jgi:hypothetical protein
MVGTRSTASPTSCLYWDAVERVPTITSPPEADEA